MPAGRDPALWGDPPLLLGARGWGAHPTSHMNETECATGSVRAKGDCFRKSQLTPLPRTRCCRALCQEEGM